MKQYHKIQTIFKRDAENNYKIMPEHYSIPEFEILKDILWEFTEKVDGTNIRVMWKDGVMTYGGKTDNAQIPSPLIAKLDTLFRNQKLADCFPETDACLYGEGFGPKIQKGGGNYGDEVDFCLFDVRIGDIWLLHEDVCDIANKLNINVVPKWGQGTLSDAVSMCENGINSLYSDNAFLAEGLVLRPKIGLLDRQGHRIIAKIKCKDFR